MVKCGHGFGQGAATPSWRQWSLCCYTRTHWHVPSHTHPLQVHLDIKSPNVLLARQVFRLPWWRGWDCPVAGTIQGWSAMAAAARAVVHCVNRGQVFLQSRGSLLFVVGDTIARQQRRIPSYRLANSPAAVFVAYALSGLVRPRLLNRQLHPNPWQGRHRQDWGRGHGAHPGAGVRDRRSRHPGLVGGIIETRAHLPQGWPACCRAPTHSTQGVNSAQRVKCTTGFSCPLFVVL